MGWKFEACPPLALTHTHKCFHPGSYKHCLPSNTCNIFPILSCSQSVLGCNLFCMLVHRRNLRLPWRVTVCRWSCLVTSFFLVLLFLSFSFKLLNVLGLSFFVVVLFFCFSLSIANLYINVSHNPSLVCAGRLSRQWKRTEKVKQRLLSVSKTASYNFSSRTMLTDTESKTRRLYFIFSWKDGTIWEQLYFWKEVVTNSWNFYELWNKVENF